MIAAGTLAVAWSETRSDLELEYFPVLARMGHAAGPTIGTWDTQKGLPVKGGYPMYADTGCSVEITAATCIPEWDQEVRTRLAEDALFDGEIVHCIDGRQASFYLICSDSAR